MVVESRDRILDAALALMGEHGVAGTSMRKLADACDLNVATLYHYFPSKDDLLRSVIAERGYLERLASEPLPVAALAAGSSPASDRLAALLRYVWEASGNEETVWRLLIGESLRGQPAAREMSNALVDGIDVALATWVAELLPEVGARAAAIARLCRGLLFALIVEHLALGPDEARSQARIAEFAEAVS